jgi:hypothetical protein
LNGGSGLEGVVFFNFDPVGFFFGDFGPETPGEANMIMIERQVIEVLDDDDWAIGPVVVNPLDDTYDCDAQAGDDPFDSQQSTGQTTGRIGGGVVNAVVATARRAGAVI